MNALEALKAEIKRKREQIEEKGVLVPNKKYFRQGDLSTKYAEEYRKKRESKLQLQESRDQQNSGESVSSNDTEVNKDYTLPRKEVIRRLRERGEPVLLYGETDLEAFRRLRKLEILEPELNRGLRNDFQEALERVDQAYLNEILKSQSQDSDMPSIHDVKVTDDKTTLDDITEMSSDLGRGDYATDAKIILTYLKFLLQMWGQQLNSRTESDKVSVKGKLSTATYAQTQSYLKPLFRKLKTKTLPEDILESLVTILQHLIDREYVMANDAYLQMAIGNAPWPIGVTMVGIHARTGREKIFSKHVAHVLNDETQRKYIQALKRLMTRCQQFFPTAPSKSVEYNA